MPQLPRRAVLGIMALIGALLGVSVLARWFEPPPEGGIRVVCVSEPPPDTTVIEADQLDFTEMPSLESVLDEAYDQAVEERENGLCEEEVSAITTTGQYSRIDRRLSEVGGDSHYYYVHYNEVIFRVEILPSPD